MTFDTKLSWVQKKTVAYLVQEIDGFIKICDGIRYLVLFVLGRQKAIHNRINYLRSDRYNYM